MRGGGVPVIKMRAGEAHLVMDELEAALVAINAPIYQRGASLVRPVRVNEVKGELKESIILNQDGEVKDDKGRVVFDNIRRAPQSLVLAQVDETWLYDYTSANCDWRAPKQGKWAYADPKTVYLHGIVKRRPAPYPIVLAIAGTPIIDASGRIVQVPGYDSQSQMLLDFEPGAFPPVPEAPTMEDARNALEVLMRPFREMPWTEAAAKSVTASAMLTSLVRGSLRTAPMHVFDSPTAGTGKSKICDAIGVLATGEVLPAMSQGKSPDEDEKRISVSLFYGDRVVLLDNCELPITGDFLCSCLTQETVQARILGESERRITPVACLFVASGNNVTVAGDMSRRTLICRIDSGAERPDERVFDFCPVQETRRDRAKMVVAGLTVLKAYHDAGRPVKSLTPMGSFEDWSDWVRGALVWLGYADPCATREAVLDSDSNKNDLLEVMQLWERVFGSLPVTISKIQGNSHTEAAALEMKLCEVSGSRDWHAKNVAGWLRRNKDRFVGGRAFRVTPGKGSSASHWRLAGAVDSGKPTTPDLPF